MLHFRLFKITLKKYIRIIPYAILGALIPILILGTLSFYVAKNINVGKDIEKTKVGIVSEDVGDGLLSKAMGYLEDMDSTSITFEFAKYTSLDEAREELKKGNLIGVLYLPQNVVEGIYYGENIPVTIYYPNNIDISAVFLTEMTKAAANFLSAAQSGTYVAAELYDRYIPEDPDYTLYEAYDAIDIINFSYVLQREDLYETVNTDLTNSINSYVFYIGTGLLLFLLLYSVAFTKALSNDENAFLILLKSKKVSTFFYLISKVICYSLIIFVFELISLFALSKINIPEVSDDLLISFNGSTLATAFLIAFAISSFSVMIFQFSKRQSNCILLLFVLSSIMCFLSGIILPKAFLPRALTLVGDKLPTTYLHSGFIKLLSGTEFHGTMPLVIYSVAFIILGIILYNIRWRRERN